MLTGWIWSWLHNKKHHNFPSNYPTNMFSHITVILCTQPSVKYNYIITQSNQSASIIMRLKLLIAECYEWVCSQLCWTIWFGTWTESCTKGQTCKREVGLESQMISEMAVFVRLCFCKPTAGSSHTSSSFKGKRYLHIPNFGSWDFKICCPQHQNLPWMSLIAANNSCWADSPLNCSSTGLSGVTCFVSLILFPLPLNNIHLWLLRLTGSFDKMRWQR